MSVEIRPLHARDAAQARRLIITELGGTPYVDAPLEALNRALGGGSPELRAAIAVRNGDVVGVIIYGVIGGAEGAGRITLVAVSAAARHQGVGTRLIDGATTELAAEGARFVIAELPDDDAAAAGRALLLRCGFVEEARVADYYRDGVALAILRRRVSR